MNDDIGRQRQPSAADTLQKRMGRGNKGLLLLIGIGPARDIGVEMRACRYRLSADRPERHIDGLYQDRCQISALIEDIRHQPRHILLKRAILLRPD